MRHTVTKLIDDLTGDEDDVSTVTFGLDGKAFEIHLSDDHQNDLHEALAVYIEHARPVKGAQRAPRSEVRVASVNNRPGREITQAMRAWLKANGYKLGERGRIPSDLKAIYHARA